MMNIISLGAGVQSSTMSLMAAHGEIEPMPDAAIFADTQAEPKAVYEWLDWLEKELPFPVYRVTFGSLKMQLLRASRGESSHTNGRPPFFTASGGMIRRQCTHDFKLLPLRRKQRELIGLKKGERGGRKVLADIWVGISLDEIWRMKDSDVPYLRRVHPLIEKRMTRHSCLLWMEKMGYPKPVKSACTFCPYHTDAMWRDMKLNDPESFAEAVEIDCAIKHISGQREPWFVHSSRIPLDQVDFSTDEDRGQLNMFNNECEGMCGV